MTTTMRKLTKAEWDDIRSLSATVTGYDPAASPIKGQTTVQILQVVLTDIQNGSFTAAEETINTLIRREAFNTFVGVEGKKRRKN